jgi:hypothetical protein
VLHLILNNGIKKEFSITRNLVKTVEPIDSDQSHLLQLADVIMGAVAYHNNNWGNRADAKKAKVDLAAYIARKAGQRDLTVDSAYTRGNFRVLRWPGRKRKRRYA